MNTISKAVVISLAVLLAVQPASAFISPSALQLIASNIGSFIWTAVISIAIFGVILLKKIKKNIRLVLLIALVVLLGIISGNAGYNFVKLREMNTYAALEQSDLDKITYEECIKNNYLDFLPTGSIALLNEDEVISILLENKSINILNIGYTGETRFKNEIFITQSSDEFEQIFLKTAMLNKSEPLLIHCWTAHSSSMIAQFLAKEGFSDIYIMKDTNPGMLQDKMLSSGLNASDIFKEAEPVYIEPVIRIPLSSVNLLKESDRFFFYKVGNCEEYIESYQIFNSENSLCSDELEPADLEQTGAKTHFLCDSEEECRLLQAKLQLSDFRQKGYMVVLYE